MLVKEGTGVVNSPHLIWTKWCIPSASSCTLTALISLRFSLMQRQAHKADADCQAHSRYDTIPS
jgi:hypothetical protein